MQTSMHPYDIHQLFCILGITCKILCPLWHRKRSQNIVKQQVQMHVQNPGHVHFLEEAINGYEILVRLKIKSEFPFFLIKGYQLIQWANSVLAILHLNQYTTLTTLLSGPQRSRSGNHKRNHELAHGLKLGNAFDVPVLRCTEKTQRPEQEIDGRM